jgi:sirohydrochlorin cobaltochelatase
MVDAVVGALEAALVDHLYIGQILIHRTTAGFVLSHRDDEARDDLQIFRNPEDAIELAKYDDTEIYRPLKTAPNLRRGWRLELRTLGELIQTLDYFYPGRLAVFAAWKSSKLQTTPLRETLDRQSGMYRVAAKISDEQVDRVVGDFCRSDGGCLRSILWKRDRQGTIASTNLPPEKFEPAFDQTLTPGSPPPAIPPRVIPLLCQEPCNLLVAECRNVVKDEIEL